MEVTNGSLKKTWWNYGTLGPGVFFWRSFELCQLNPEGIGFSFFKKTISCKLICNISIWYSISHFKLGFHPDFFKQQLSGKKPCSFCLDSPGNLIRFRIRHSGCRLGLWWCQSVFGVCTRTERRGWLVPQAGHLAFQVSLRWGSFNWLMIQIMRSLNKWEVWCISFRDLYYKSHWLNMLNGRKLKDWNLYTGLNSPRLKWAVLWEPAHLLTTRQSQWQWMSNRDDMKVEQLYSDQTSWSYRIF